MRRSLALQLLFMLSYGAFMFVFALTVQDGLHASPLRSGLAIVPMAVAFFIGSLFAPRAITRLDARKTVAVGATVDGIGLAGLILIVVGGWPHVGLLALAPARTVISSARLVMVRGVTVGSWPG